MAECRYFPECQRCNEVGDLWIPCTGGADGIQCGAYEPMPDVGALLALADEMDAYTECDDERCGKEMPPGDIHDFARRIRVILKGDKNGEA